MQEHRVSFRYAKALLESAIKEGVSEKILNDFQIVKLFFESSSELRTLAASPVVQLWKKRKAIEEIFKDEHISKMTLEFLLFLIDKRRGDLILSIISEYETQYNVANNRLSIQISSAVELNDKIKNDILDKITALTQKEILPEYTIDKSLKGGILVRIDDWIFDATIKNQLNNLHKILIEGQI